MKTGRAVTARKSFKGFELPANPEALRYRIAPGIRGRWDGFYEAALAAYTANPSNDRRPQDTKPNVFKREVYGRLKPMIRAEHHFFIRTLVEHVRSKPMGTVFSDNPYHWALFLLSKCEGFEGLTDNAVNEIGRQLIYAHRHWIEPELLVGFLYQTGVTNKAKQALIKQADFREPWLAGYKARLNLPDDRL